MKACGTVKLTLETKARLTALKTHPRETYDDVVARLTELAVDREPVDEELADQLRQSDADVRAGRLVDLDAVCSDLRL
jgi:hypothetical protein